MIAAAGIQAVLDTKQALLVDLVSVTIRRGRCHQFDANGVYTGTKEILDTVRWTSAPRSLRTSATAPDGGKLYDPLAGVAYQRGSLEASVGSEVLQVSMRVTGTLPVYLSTAQDGSGSFATTLAELALLGMLEGAWVTIDQAVVQDLPATPASAGASYGVLSPDPVRVFGGVIRGAKPTSWGIKFDCCDPLILGGGSVPRNLFSPLCRWEFAGGSGCPVVRSEGGSIRTNIQKAGSDVTFPDANTVSIALAVPGNYSWAFLVPQDGPMMGMRFQIGGFRSGTLFDFADRLPWPWGCTWVQIEETCSKAWTSPANVYTSALPCASWDAYLKANGQLGGTLASFGGSPDMPKPESA